MKFGLSRTEISTYIPTIASKVIGAIFSALQPSPPWFAYSTSIVWHVSRRFRIGRQAELHPQQQSRHFLRQRHSPYRRRSPRQTLCLYSSSMQMREDCRLIRYAPFVKPLIAGRMPRHSALKDVVRRGLSAAGIPSMLKPSGHDRGDGKRPNGITLYPYSRSRCLIWDATWVNIFPSSNRIQAALAAGTVADAAEV